MRLTIWQIILMVLLGLVPNWSVFSHPEDHDFVQSRWTTEKGLPQNTINAMAQTADGFIWVGTPGGLASFDGNRFKVFTNENTPQLKDNRISALTVNGTDESLWIGTESGEIIQYKNKNFVTINDGSINGKSRINSLTALKNGEVWVGTKFGLQVCQTDCRRTDFTEPVTQIRQDSEGKLWFLSRQKLFKIENGQFMGEANLAANIVAIETNPKGGMWLIKANEFGRFQNGEYRQLKNFSERVWAAGTATTKDGKIWLDVNGKLISGIGDKIEELELTGEVSTASCLMTDQNDDLWIGRQIEGLFQLLPQRINKLSDVADLPFESFYSMVEAPDRSWWFTTKDGLFRWKEGKTENLINDNFNSEGALFFDKNGTLWSNCARGLQSYRDGKITLHYQFNPAHKSFGGILFADSKGNLWFGNSGFGVGVLDSQNKLSFYTVENGLAGNLLSVITETQDGAMWFGTTTGLSRLIDGEFTSWTTADGLSNDYVRDLFEDKNNSLWIGTYGGGIIRFKEGKFKTISARSGLCDDIAARILPDENANLWILGNRGIFSVSRQMLDDFADGRITRIYCNINAATHGLLKNEIESGYQWDGNRLSDGHIWFLTNEGAAIIDPKDYGLNPPKPIIEEFLEERVNIPYSDQIVLESDHEDIEIHYTGIDFRNSDQLRFRYKMNGYDDDWEEVETRRVAIYPRLPNGEFKFQVTAASPNGVWSSEIAELKIIIKTPFYRTWWFYGLGAGLILLLIFSAFRYRNWHFAQEKAVREEFAQRLLVAQEKERQRIAGEIHDNVGQQLLIIKNWAVYCLGKIGKTSKVRDQIIQISETAEEALHDIRLIAKNLSPYHLDKAGLTNTIIFMVKQVAEPSEIVFMTDVDDVNGVLSKEDEINLYRIVQESVSNIVKHSHAKNAKVSLKRLGNRLKLKITDDGIGFKEAVDDYQKFGTGLNGMTERAKMLNGNFSVKSMPNQGTEISLTLNLKPPLI